jgi:hypothetical protein
VEGKHKTFAVSHVATLLLDWLCQMSPKHMIVLVFNNQNGLLRVLQVVEESVVRLTVTVDGEK